MKMTMVLLVATVALLVSADAAATKWKAKGRIHDTIIRLARLLNESSFKEEFVPEVEAGECGSKFFCIVSDILDNNKTISTWPKKEVLVENVKKFHEQENVNCSAILKDVQPNGVKIQMKLLIHRLEACMQQKNWDGTK